MVILTIINCKKLFFFLLLGIQDMDDGTLDDTVSIKMWFKLVARPYASYSELE